LHDNTVDNIIFGKAVLYYIINLRTR